MSLRDRLVRARVLFRLRQMQAGNPGDIRSVGGGVSELRIHAGAGYRIYFGRHGGAVVVLLCGGDKASQDSDIQQAKLFWNDWKAR